VGGPPGAGQAGKFFSECERLGRHVSGSRDSPGRRGVPRPHGPYHPPEFKGNSGLRPIEASLLHLSDAALHEGLVNRLFAPGQTRMANVAHFMCELTTSQATWGAWRGKHPVIVDVTAAREVA